MIRYIASSVPLSSRVFLVNQLSVLDRALENNNSVEVRFLWLSVSVHCLLAWLLWTKAGQNMAVNVGGGGCSVQGGREVENESTVLQGLGDRVQLSKPHQHLVPGIPHLPQPVYRSFFRNLP